MLFHSPSDSLLVLLFALLLAMALDALAALLPPLGQAWGAPGRWVSRLIGWLRDKLNRANRGEKVLRMRGVILTFALLAAALLSGWAATELAAMGQGGIVIEIALMARLLAAVPLLAATKRLRRLIRAGQSQSLEAAVRHVVRRDALMADGHGVLRAVIESFAEACNAALMAPLLAYILFGLPGALALRLFALQAWRGRDPIGRRGFSDAARSVWNGLARLPGLLAGPGIALAACALPGANGGAAFGQWWLHIARLSLIPATFGAALGVSLGGPRTGSPDLPWLGGPSARPTEYQLRLAARLFWLVRGLALVALGLVWSRVAA